MSQQLTPGPRRSPAPRLSRFAPKTMLIIFWDRDRADSLRLAASRGDDQRQALL
ncbi:hypothetical protein KIN20_004191 [Parelaphostrongylus tenuis]|uniref:Uncharacterized protein n=1 Tax=Parelaphostrongylus tenuis TaxID=148309 RepID=A0AAD5LY14_PARTN|nr:hypothetical protein KIN20_004191 [Parelaphostrongylus tenuis]